MSHWHRNQARAEAQAANRNAAQAAQVTAQVTEVVAAERKRCAAIAGAAYRVGRPSAAIDPMMDGTPAEAAIEALNTLPFNPLLAIPPADNPTPDDYPLTGRPVV